jgi:hypothetical protein
MKLLYTEDDIQRALTDVANWKSVRKACLDWAVPRATLQDRINSRVSRSEANEPSQRLSPVQEQRLTDWVLVQEALGGSPTHSQIRAFAGRILAARSDAGGFIYKDRFLLTNPCDGLGRVAAYSEPFRGLSLNGVASGARSVSLLALVCSSLLLFSLYFSIILRS